MSDLISRQAAIDAIVSKLDSIDHVPQWVFDELTNVMEELPSTQPEIIRCKDCRWKQGAECVRFADVRPFPDDFCSRSERREE